jgi:hypothetical protein
MVCLNGDTKIRFRKNPNEEYKISYPNLYARGLFFGDSFIEISGKSTISCESLGQLAIIEFNAEGYFNGERDAISGEINTGMEVFNLEGKWSSKIIFSSNNKVI